MSGRTTTTQCAVATTVANLSVPRVSSHRLSLTLLPAFSFSFSLCLSFSCEYRSTTTISTAVVRDGHCWNLARPRGHAAFAPYIGIRKVAKSNNPLFFSVILFPTNLVPALSVTHSPFYGYCATRKIFYEVARLTGPPRMQPLLHGSHEIYLSFSLYSLSFLFAMSIRQRQWRIYHARRPGTSQQSA